MTSVHRIVHLGAGNLYGGIETFLVTLANHRAACPDIEPHFVLAFEGRLTSELRAAGAHVHVLEPTHFSKPWTIVAARRRLRALLAREGFAAAIAHGCWPHVVHAPVVRNAGVRLMFFAHGTLSGRHWLERWARLTRPQFVIANSRHTASSVHRVFPGVRTDVVYYPCDMMLTAQRAAVRARVRVSLGTTEDDVVIVTTCRLDPWKGHRLLLDALARLRSTTRNRWVAWIAGGSQRPKEERWLATLRGTAERGGIAGHVRFLGQRSDVPDLLAAADIHCQPNTGPEPFGLAFVEALWTGLPVVTTAMGGALEIIDDRCGVLVDPEQGALAAALGRLIDDPFERERLGAFGPTRARALCDPETRVRELGQLALHSAPVRAVVEATKP